MTAHDARQVIDSLPFVTQKRTNLHEKSIYPKKVDLHINTLSFPSWKPRRLMLHKLGRKRRINSIRKIFFVANKFCWHLRNSLPT
jgi:hypothetical protein